MNKFLITLNTILISLVIGFSGLGTIGLLVGKNMELGPLLMLLLFTGIILFPLFFWRGKLNKSKTLNSNTPSTIQKEVTLKDTSKPKVKEERLQKENQEKERLQKELEEKERLQKEEEEKERLQKEKEEKESLQKEKYSILLKELDTDGNGIIDLVEGDDYGKILKLNQDKIIEINSDYIKKLVQISTDYVYANASHAPSELSVPVHGENWYSYTKLLADGYIELKGKNYLIIRCGHKPTPFPFDTAYSDIVGNFDYVNVIAAGIISLINKNSVGLYNVGTETKTIYELAKETRPDVKEGLRRGWMPKDIRMNCTKFKNKTT